MSEQLVEITVNGKTVSAKPGEMVIAAAERAGDFIHASATTLGCHLLACVGSVLSRSTPGADRCCSHRAWCRFHRE